MNWPLAAAAATGVQVGAAIVASRFAVAEVAPLTLAMLRYAIGFFCLLPFVLKPYWPSVHGGRAQCAIKTRASDLLAMAALGIGQFGVLIALLNFGLQRVPLIGAQAWWATSSSASPAAQVRKNCQAARLRLVAPQPQEHRMHTIDQDQAFHVTGIELRTTNEEAFRTIPGHWQRFAQEGIAARVPGKQSDEVYAVYTNFQNAGRDNQGLYSLVLGMPVAPDAPVPDGMLRVVLPAARRAVFPVERGRFDLVGAKWQEIWARSDLAKTFIAEAERYRADGQIEILVGIEKEAAPA